MLAYAYQALAMTEYKDIETESFDNIYDLFASIISKGIVSQLKRGLYREYVETSSALASLRGKIDMRESINLIINRVNQLHCTYDELTENAYMNKILKTTGLILLGQRDIKIKNRNALKKGIRYFSEIDTLDIRHIAWDRLRFHRNNHSYRMLMGICYLILHDLLLTQEKGNRKLAEFLDDQKMFRLYESFIRAYYQRHFPEYNPKPKEIQWDTEHKHPFLPVMVSDVFLSNGKKKLIIDAKYYGEIFRKHYDNEIIRSGHLYQIYAYVKNEDKNHSGNTDGVLLYAKTGECPVDALDYRIGGSKISVKILDLDKPFQQIQIQLKNIISEWQKEDHFLKFGLGMEL
jgi:5-methylcytosine-specific restriction enzyme subunit McrC